MKIEARLVQHNYIKLIFEPEGPRDFLAQDKGLFSMFLLDSLVELRITSHIKTQLVIKVSKSSPSSNLGRSGK